MVRIACGLLAGSVLISAAAVAQPGTWVVTGKGAGNAATVAARLRGQATYRICVTESATDGAVRAFDQGDAGTGFVDIRQGTCTDLVVGTSLKIRLLDDSPLSSARGTFDRVN
jgi:hypothetical protein